ncbi:pyridoxamine 5'-phosphate oxidase family protein [Hoeflea sp. WL0058]|uniref:Pyridoxamine 5'-phosphate oxidase family protein n=1 Tax=Flavimaribacter sediminis TaxID=2865987 RepID=A0AAE2ZNW1_9HYPH|nr:pyridoxamine 5'-phosphate oxidase family protein [Flavimaribacter sediminis]MBW8640309.1 pyridoxamine 5'-phosphate oxidase family protein [Flavimaribacter sediminis]
MKFIETREELRTVYREAKGGAVLKELKKLEQHAKGFLSRCPFVVIGSQDAVGNADATPKGDKPGFVKVLDDTTIAIPDRPGNNRLDTWENIIQNPAVGLLFLIPGMNETLRINGIARLTTDDDLRQEFAVDGRPALAVMVVEIKAVYMHCAKAFMRSQLWQPETWPNRTELPTLGQIMRDQLALAQSGEELDANLADGYAKSMW